MGVALYAQMEGEGTNICESVLQFSMKDFPCLL